MRRAVLEKVVISRTYTPHKEQLGAHREREGTSSLSAPCIISRAGQNTN
jgi:hypothetical protein